MIHPSIDVYLIKTQVDKIIILRFKNFRTLFPRQNFQSVKYSNIGSEKHFYSTFLSRNIYFLITFFQI